MHDIDCLMLANGYRYIRYADDVLIVNQEAFDYFKEQVDKLHIKINPNKTAVLNIKTGITFLGFYYLGKEIDISKEALAKMMSRMKRRAKWYRVWMHQRHVNKHSALYDYIKKINYKLYSNLDDTINWSRWYLPNITTTKTLRFLDNYFVDCIRYLNSGTWQKGKKFYELSYEEIKKLGYKSLLHEYYLIKKEKKLN
jgi:hypothetical protein